MLSAEAALEKVIAQREEPVISAYELFRELWRLYHNRSLDGQPIRVRKKSPTFGDYTKIIGRLLDRKILIPDPDFSKEWQYLDSQQNVFRVVAFPDSSAEEICALIDPFCCVSYLSAMQRYALTDRSPDSLILSTPAIALWRSLRDEKVRGDYGVRDNTEEIKPLDFIDLPDRLRSRQVNRHQVKYPPQSVRVRGSFVRVAKIGDTFEQTLDKPEWCGGMSHVLDVWEKNARQYLTEIVEAVDRSPRSIIKVRAGYILDELLGIKKPEIENWQQFAQRGGSRKLSPTEEYKPVYSEKWMISINV